MKKEPQKTTRLRGKVPESMNIPADDVKVKLGKRMRELRKARNLTIKEVAALSGISVNGLSLIENGNTSPSVHTLHEISKVYNIPISEFFDEKYEEKNVVFTKKAHQKGIHFEKMVFTRLDENLQGNVCSSTFVKLTEEGMSGKAEVSHIGYEFAYCLNGKLLYAVAGNHYLLEPGDSLVFASDLPHNWKNLHKGETEFLLIIANMAPSLGDIFNETHGISA